MRILYCRNCMTYSINVVALITVVAFFTLITGKSVLGACGSDGFNFFVAVSGRGERLVLGLFAPNALLIYVTILGAGGAKLVDFAEIMTLCIIFI